MERQAQEMGQKWSWKHQPTSQQGTGPVRTRLLRCSWRIHFCATSPVPDSTPAQRSSCSPRVWIWLPLSQPPTLTPPLCILLSKPEAHVCVQLAEPQSFPAKVTRKQTIQLFSLSSKIVSPLPANIIGWEFPKHWEISRLTSSKNHQWAF